MFCDCNAGDICCFCCFCWFYLITTWQFPHGQLRLKSFLILNSDATRGTSSSSQNLYELRQWINGLLTSYDFHRCWSTSRSLIHKSHHFVGFLNPRSYHVWWWKNPRFSVWNVFQIWMSTLPFRCQKNSPHPHITALETTNLCWWK